MHHAQHSQPYEDQSHPHGQHQQHTQYHTNAQSKETNKGMLGVSSPPSSQHSEHKDDIKEPQHIGYSSASNTISPQQSNPNDVQNIASDNMQYAFTNETVKELATNLGFEPEYVRMALIQAQGDISFAAEILFRMNDKTVKAIKKIEKHKKKQKHTLCLNAIFGMDAKQLKKQWKAVIGDKSKSDLRAMARRECLDDLEDESDTSSVSDNSNSDLRSITNNSFYKKNKGAIDSKQNILCQSGRNVLFVLRLYGQWKIKPMVYFHILIENCLSHYGLIQLMNDFYHIHIYHWDHCDLFCAFERSMGECSIGECISFARHYRDRSLYRKDMFRYKLYELQLNEESDEELKELTCIQFMDEIHCYLMHSLMKYEDNDDDDDDDDDADADVDKEEENKKKENMKLMMLRKQELVQYGYGRSYGRISDNEHKDDDDDGDTLHVYKWQSTLNIGNNMNISARFASFRDEIVNNPYYALTVNEWNELYTKCSQISLCWIRKRIRAKEKYQDKVHKIKMKKGDAISIEFIMAIKLYTDYDALQYELKKCLRGNIDYNLSNLYQWRNMLLIAVSKFGIRMKSHKFFYGCKSKLEISNCCGFGLFNGPLSMTISLSIAKQFANDCGMLMQMGNAHPWIKDKENGNGRYFDVSVLSDYKNEHEILTMLFTTRLYMVSCNEYIDDNLRNISPVLFTFVCRLFDQCVLSMNYELEQTVIKLIENKLDKRNKRQIPSKYSYVFNELCDDKSCVMLWDISYGLQKYFLESTQYDDDFDDDDDTEDDDDDIARDDDDHKLLISFSKINALFPNLKSLTIINHTLSNEVFYQLMDYLNKNNGAISYEIITFYFPKYKKLPLRLRINQLQHVWHKYLNKYDFIIEGYKYGASLSPMVVIKRSNSKLMPFIGEENYQNHFVKIEK